MNAKMDSQMEDAENIEDDQTEETIDTTIDTEEVQETSRTKKKKRELSKNELNALEYNLKLKTISQQPQPFRCHFPLARSRPACLLRDAMARHDLNNALKLFILISKDTRSCPFQLTKTGYLLLRKFIQLEPDRKSELDEEVLSLFRTYRSVQGTPVLELFLDFFNFWFESGGEFLPELVNFRNHIRSANLNNKHMVLFLNMLQTFANDFKNEGLDYKQYANDDIKKNDYESICLQLKKITIGFDSENDHPLDYLFLNLIDLLVLAERFDEAKENLLMYHEQFPTNLNAVIYILKFNELYIKDDELFKKFYDILLELDQSNSLVIFYLNKVDLTIKRLKVVMNYIDFTANKEDHRAWKALYEDLISLEKDSNEEQDVKAYYQSLFASYWPTYHFHTLTVKINKETCDFIFHKAFTFHYFQPNESFIFLSKILTILSFAKSDKCVLLKDLIVQ